MFDIGASEFLLIVVVAIVVIGPKDLPRAMRLAGQWIAKVRRVSGHFRAGIETMIREAELAEMEQKWREQNAAILKEHPAEAYSGEPPAATAESALPAPAPVTEAAAEEPVKTIMLEVPEHHDQPEPEPQLPLPPR